MPLFRIAGIRVRLDYSWFLIFLLVLLGLSLGYFPGLAPEAEPASHWVAGLVATLLLFASILIHELAHSWVALRAGIPVPEIRLFLFGGVSRMEREPASPPIELRVAIAGPLMSFALAGGCYLLGVATAGAPWMIPAIFSYLAWINLALGVFNLLPGYPLDGGRVLRALVWWKTGSLRRGTKIASDVGKTFAIALMVLGAVQILSGALVGGVWMILIAMLIRGLARRGYEDLLIRRALADVDVERVMVPRHELVTVEPELLLRDLVEDYFLGRGYRGFPVVDDGQVVGLVSAEDVRGVDKGEWSSVRVADVMRPLERSRTIAPDATLLDAAERFSRSRRRLLVMREGELLGLLSAGSLSRFVEVRTLVEGG